MAEALDPAETLRQAASGNAELRRLLAERDMLVQRMQEIADRSPGAFAGHDVVRYPVEPLGERRGQDARWAQARDDSRSAAIQRILQARRRDATDKADQWPEERERQRVRAATDVQAEREEAEAQARALDERIERARRELLAERWAARQNESEDDWHALRQQQAAEALAEGRARAAAAAEREQALERRIASAAARRPDDWSERLERRRAQALKLARRQAAEAAAVEQDLERRLERAREDRLRENRAAQDPERAPKWLPPSDRRNAGSPPPEPPRRLPPTAAERSLDERIARARDAASAERRTMVADPSLRGPTERTAQVKAHLAGRPARHREEALRPTPRREKETVRPRPAATTDSAERFAARRDDRTRAASHGAEPEPRGRRTAPSRTPDRSPSSAERTRPAAAVDRARPSAEESFEGRQDRLRAKRAEARRQQARAKRIGDAAIRRIERAAGAVRKLDSNLDRLGRELREIGADEEMLRQVDRVRTATARLSSRAEPVERPAGTGRDALRQGGRTAGAAGGGSGALRAWQERHDRRQREPARRDEPGGLRASGERMLGMSTGSTDEVFALRDKARELWPKKKKKEEEKTPPPKTTAERLEDLDKRREQALERLKAKRRGEQREERRRGFSLDRLASLGDRFGSPGGLRR